MSAYIYGWHILIPIILLSWIVAGVYQGYRRYRAHHSLQRRLIRYRSHFKPLWPIDWKRL